MGESRIHCAVIPNSWQEVCILLQREGYGAVAELEAYRFRVHPLRQENTTASMARRCVKGRIWQPSPSQDGLERTTE